VTAAPDAVGRLAGQIAAALEAADLAAYRDLLDPAVTWGPPEQPRSGCRSRDQVLAWYARGREAGTRASVTETAVFGDKILVGLLVTGRSDAVGEPHGEERRWQVLTVRDGKVTEIVGFEDREQAMAQGGLGRD